MARTALPPISDDDRRTVGGMLRDIRRGAGDRSVEATATTKGCPASRQTIYRYERGALTPSLAQFLELVEFYVLRAGPGGEDARDATSQRVAGVAAVARALDLPVYHVAQARQLMTEMQPDIGSLR